MLHLDILQPVDGPGLLRDLAARPFLNPGRLQIETRRKTPTWLPPAAEYLYAGQDGVLYGARVHDTGLADPPKKVGDLAEIVFGRGLLQRFADTSHPGFIFETREAKALAACLADDTEIDLPAARALRLIGEGERIYLSRGVLVYALLEAVRVVGRGNARYAARHTEQHHPHHIPLTAAPEDLWTLRRVFGTIR